MNSKLMKALAVLLFLTLIGAAFLSIHAQDKPPAIPWSKTSQTPTEYLLSTEEAKAWADFDAAETQIGRALNEAVAAAINTSVGAASLEVHGRISQAGLVLELTRARRAAWLADLRARERCATCTIEGGRLIPPKDPKK